MDLTTRTALLTWKETLSPREKELHELAAVLLKKTLVVSSEDKDNGSYFPEKSHAFTQWWKAQKNPKK